MGERPVPAYVNRQRAAQELCMSPETFDSYVRKGVLPPAKKRGGLARWKWKEIEAALDGGEFSVVQSQSDPYDLGVERAKATHIRAS